MQNAPIFLLNGEVIWQASDSSLSKELHALVQSYKQSTILIYDSRVILTSNLTLVRLYSCKLRS